MGPGTCWFLNNSKFGHRGNPIVPYGSTQTVEIAVVVGKPPGTEYTKSVDRTFREEDPNDFHDVVANHEYLDNCAGAPRTCDIVLWYAGSSTAPKDAFF